MIDHTRPRTVPVRLTHSPSPRLFTEPHTSRLVGAALAAFIVFGAHASGDAQGDADSEERQALEDEMFGGGGAQAESTTEDDGARSTDRARDEAIFGEATATARVDSEAGDAESRIAARLGQEERDVAIGGRVFLQANVLLRQDPEVFEQPIVAPSLLDLYIDARPTDRLRAYARGRITHTASVSQEPVEVFGQTFIPQQDQANLDQLWLKFDIGRAVFVTAGRQTIRWGSGRIWNPTDFLNPQRLDPLAIFDLRLGVDLLKFHVPIESLGWNFYALGVFNEADTVQRVGGALRLEMLADTAEFAISAALRRDEPIRLGADVSAGIGPLEFHLESAFLTDVRTPYWTGELLLEQFRFLLPEPTDRRDEWIVQSNAGVEWQIDYGDSESLILGAEYFFNTFGYDSGNLYPAALVSGGFTPLYLGRHYTAAYLVLPSPGDLDDTSFFISSIFNVSDLSVLTRFDVRVQLLTDLTFNAFVAAHAGANDGEFRLEFDIPPLPGVTIPGLDQGISVPPQLIELGVSLALNF